VFQARSAARARPWVELDEALRELFPFVRAADADRGFLGKVKRRKMGYSMVRFINPDEVERARFWVRMENDVFGPEAFRAYD